MEHTDLDNLGGNLKAARKSRKLTREKVAESVGISPRYLSALENEHKKPSLNLLYRLVRTLEMSADTIFYSEIESKSDELAQFTQRLSLCDEMDMNIMNATLTAILENKERASKSKVKEK
ncbi:MAG: helix-turn-helix transcriptional regulator [Ruminococcaceae bacterium]|nr:helix-turn-helix transcriptional regulator [Oscillospiraceae bacterium]